MNIKNLTSYKQQCIIDNIPKDRIKETYCLKCYKQDIPLIHLNLETYDYFMGVCNKCGI